MDTLDLFCTSVVTYRASLWLYGSTDGVTTLGGVFETPEEAQEALAAHSKEPLAFTAVQGRDLAYASQVWKEKRNIAVVFKDSGTLVCEAALPQGWVLPRDPRRA